MPRTLNCRAMPGCRTPDRPSCTVVPGTLGHDTCAEDSCLKRVIINAADPFTGLDDPLFAPDMIILTWVIQLMLGRRLVYQALLARRGELGRAQITYAGAETCSATSDFITV